MVKFFLLNSKLLKKCQILGKFKIPKYSKILRNVYLKKIQTYHADESRNKEHCASNRCPSPVRLHLG